MVSRRVMSMGMGIMCLTILCGCTNKTVKEKETEVSLQNTAVENKLSELEINTAVAAANRDKVVDFMVNGIFNEEISNLFMPETLEEIKLEAYEHEYEESVNVVPKDERELNWYMIGYELDEGDMGIVELRADFEDGIGNFARSEIDYYEYHDENGELQEGYLEVEDPKWLFEKWNIVENGMYNSTEGDGTTQFMVVEGDGCSCSIKIEWRNGKIVAFTRNLSR